MNINPDIYYLVCGAPAEDLLDTPVLVMPLDCEFFEFIDARRAKVSELHDLNAESVNFSWGNLEWASCGIFEPATSDEESYYDSLMVGEPTEPVLGSEIIDMGITGVYGSVRVYGSWLKVRIREDYPPGVNQPLFRTLVFAVCGREKHRDIYFETPDFEYEKIKHAVHERATVAAAK